MRPPEILTSRQLAALLRCANRVDDYLTCEHFVQFGHVGHLQFGPQLHTPFTLQAQSGAHVQLAPHTAEQAELQQLPQLVVPQELPHSDRCG